MFVCTRKTIFLGWDGLRGLVSKILPELGSHDVRSVCIQDSLFISLGLVHMSQISSKSACKGKFAPLATYLGELTLMEVEHLLATYPLQDFLAQFPAELRVTALLFCNCVQEVVWGFDVPANQTQASFAKGQLVATSKTNVKYFAEFIRANRKTLQALDLSNNDLSSESALAFAYILATQLEEGQLQSLNISRTNATPAWISSVRSRVGGRMIENEDEDDSSHTTTASQ